MHSTTLIVELDSLRCEIDRSATVSTCKKLQVSITIQHRRSVSKVAKGTAHWVEAAAAHEVKGVILESKRVVVIEPILS